MSGSRTQFVEDLVRRYDGLLRRFLSRVSRREDVADLANDCYVRILSIADPTQIRHPRAFLMQTARNLITDRTRRSQHEVTSDDLPEPVDELPGHGPLPDEGASAEQLQQALHLALENMPPMTAQIFRLRRLEGRTSAEIAESLEITQRTVQKHLALALTILAERLDAFLPEASS